MSEQPKSTPSNFQTIIFMVILSFVCALILSVLASALAEPQAIAKDLDRSKQMMIAAKILDYDGYFLLQDDAGNLQPAQDKDGILIPGTANDIASQKQLLDVYQRRLIPLLVDDRGNLTTFKAAGLDEEKYVNEFRKTGYYAQPQKLIYKLLPNGSKESMHEDPSTSDAQGWVIPINGYGLWDAIYGYLTVAPDGVTVIGISWYDQKETPGLGANISEKYWQDLFPGKKIFQASPSGEIDFKSAPLGLTVVKGKVSEVYGDSAKAKSAVDGMAGATLTGNGVTDGYRTVLAGYRPFLVRLNEEYRKQEKNS